MTSPKSSPRPPSSASRSAPDPVGGQGTTLSPAIAEALRAALDQITTAGADGGRARYAHAKTTAVVHEGGRLKEVGACGEIKILLEVLIDGRRATALGNRLEALPALAEQALALARQGSISHFDRWPAAEPVSAPRTYAPAVAGLDRDDLIASATAMAAPLQARDADLYVKASAQRGIRESLLLTTGGVEHATARTWWGMGAFLQRTQGTDMLMANRGRGWGALDERYAPAAVAEELQEMLRLAERTVPAPTGPTRVLLTPEAFRTWLRGIWMGINGRTVAKGESPLAGRVGERILAPAITIEDQPHRPHSPSARALDENGVPTRTRTLIDQGVLTGFLYDLDSAGLAGEEPTGHDHCAPIDPILRPGARPWAELLAGIDDGLLLTSNLIGFGQGNLINGDFSANVGLGYRVQNGEIVGRVKDTMVAGNLYAILGGTVALSREREYAEAYPYALVEGVTSSRP